MMILANGTMVHGLDHSSLPTGANHAAAHARGATGTGIPIGVIEGNSGLNAANNLGGRLLGQWSFAGQTPGMGPDLTFVPTGNNHTTLVADIAAGMHATHLGVAPNANVYYAGRSSSVGGNPAAVANNAVFHSYREAVNWLYTPIGAGANQHPRIALYTNSWGAPFENNDNGLNRFASFVDYFSSSRDALFIGAAGNNRNAGEPGINWPWDHYNGITVGALDKAADNRFHTRATFSQYWLGTDNGTAPDIRGKPDIVAPGRSISDGTLTDTGTSFATPHVAGTAALLMERGLPLPGPANRNHQAIKAIILNSARKHHIAGVNAGNGLAFDSAGTALEASDEDYLVGNVLRVGGTTGAVPPTHPTPYWTPSKWSYDGSLFTTLGPLDDELGTGALDADRAIVQFDYGEFLPGPVGHIGWNRNAISSILPENSYCLDVPLRQGDFITTTLAWDRIVSEVQADGSPGNGIVETGDSYLPGIVPNLDLRIAFQGVRFASSISLVDNVEHLHVPVPHDGQPGDYCIVTSTFGGNVPFTDYGLAWWTVPEPGSAGILILIAVLARRRT